ncbi:hypothetical protein CKAH01_13568 [Colletotrichum kahawae]|uniref:Uncharacterized protein n=1 Tax=Colletotrichum kahawae TaxID=34407 RepID=A0AAD9YQI6_COLKA|nr:hypothetical protein CKAH01_13568 [Colletotrichum kahawae]
MRYPLREGVTSASGGSSSPHIINSGNAVHRMTHCGRIL